jgi:hypothetical protein
MAPEQRAGRRRADTGALLAEVRYVRLLREVVAIGWRAAIAAGSHGDRWRRPTSRRRVR